MKTVLIAGFIFIVVSAIDRHTLLDYTETCLDSSFHKTRPGPEYSLFKQCSPWKDRSCCTQKVSQDMHISEAWMNFNMSHCGPLTEQCSKHFMQDNCFYQCSPNVGPWLQKIDRVLSKEKFYNVPLCESECNNWFEACKNDLTCLNNWGKGFDWSSGRNKCPSDKPCKPFKEIFGTAQRFCEQVWDYSWKVVDDSDACMKIWFDGSKPNPNDHIAVAKAKEIVALIG